MNRPANLPSRHPPSMSKPRHPNRFHAERQQAEEFRRWRDAPGNPPAADSPVIRAKLEQIAPAPKLEPIVTDELTKEAQAQIEEILGEPRKRAPWEVRQRFPGGWINAPYVRCEKLRSLATSQEFREMGL